MSMLIGKFNRPPVPGTTPVMAWDGTHFAPTDTISITGALSAASAIITGALVLGSLTLGAALGLASGGTGADLSGTGGANQFVRQSTLGGALTVSALAAADIPSSLNATTFAGLTNSGLTATRVTYAGTAGLLSDDSGFTRTALALTLDANTDNVLTTGYGKLGFATSGTSTAFYIAQASNFNSTDYALQQDQPGSTYINTKSGQTFRIRIGNATRATFTSTASSFSSSNPVTFSDTTDGASGSSGSINTLGGIGVTKAVWIGTNLTVANGIQANSVTDAITSAVTQMASFSHLSSGTVANGFGVRTLFNMHDDGATLRNAGAIDCRWTTAASATRTAEIRFLTVNSAGALATGFTIGGASCTFAASFPVTISDTSAACLTLSGGLSIADAKDIALGSSTGNKIGTATTQKIGFWNATPIAQKTGYGTPTGNVQTASFAGTAATLVQTAGELSQLLLDLKAAGIIGA